MNLCFVSGEDKMSIELLAGKPSFLNTILLFHIEASREGLLLGRRHCGCLAPRRWRAIKSIMLDRDYVL